MNSISVFAQILHQPRQYLPDAIGQLALFLLQQQDVDLQRLLSDRDFLFQVVVAAQLPAQQVGQQRMPPRADLPGLRLGRLLGWLGRRTHGANRSSG